MRSPADPTVEDAEDASDIVCSLHLFAFVDASADLTTQEERIELFHSDGTCPKPLEPEHEADARGIPLRRILINQYFAVTLGNVTATAASEPPQDLMPSEEGFTIGRPVFYFVGFLFGLYLWLTAYAAYISLRRVFFS